MGFWVLENMINKIMRISNGTRAGRIFVVLIIFLVFASARIIFAYSSPVSFGNFFGGRIIITKATKIATLESTGYVCFIPGTTISIFPMGSPVGTPTDYLIPSYVTPRTRTTPRTGQLILGKYSGQMTVSCTLPGDPPITTTVSLNTITLFGTSR